MTAPAAGPPAADPATTEPTTTAPAATPPAAVPAPATTAPADEHPDEAFDLKPEDPPYVKRLRTQGAGYRMKVREAEAENTALKAKLAEYEQRDKAAAAGKVADIAKAHGLWDEAAAGGKGALIPGITLGDDPAQYEEIAKGIAARLGGAAGGRRGRPATVAAKTSGTSDSDLASSGTTKAATALREFMTARGNTGNAG